MLIIITNFLNAVFLIAIEINWNRQPREIIEDSIPVRLSEKPNSLVIVARKEDATRIDIRYSSIDSQIYINLPVFKCFSEKEFIYITQTKYITIFKKINLKD